jgi:hypothetical protein
MPRALVVAHQRWRPVRHLPTNYLSADNRKHVPAAPHPWVHHPQMSPVLTPKMALLSLVLSDWLRPRVQKKSTLCMGVPRALCANFFCLALSVGDPIRPGLCRQFLPSFGVGVFICSNTVFKLRVHWIQLLLFQLLAHARGGFGGWWFWGSVR